MLAPPYFQAVCRANDFFKPDKLFAPFLCPTTTSMTRVRFLPVSMTLLVAWACSSSCATSSITQPAMFSTTPPNAFHASLASNGESESITIVEPIELLDPTPALLIANAAVDKSLQSAAKRVIGWWKPQSDTLDYRAILDSTRTIEGSLSVGYPRSGGVIGSVELPFNGAHYSIIERHRARNTRFGTQQMIDIIQHGAAQVDKVYPNSVLRMGNIGTKHGGKIPWSVTHHTGRDADIAFYVKRIKDGLHVPSPDLLFIDEKGIAIDRRDLQFDVDRNWILVKALLTHPEIETQWLFISEPLKQMLLARAEMLGEDPELIERASQVLHQPTESLPHDDHLHLRITCSKRDRLEGCLDSGPYWPWIDWHDQALFARSLELMQAFDDPKPEIRLAALDFLEKIRSPFAPEVALVRGVRDSEPRVRKRALEVARAIPSWSATSIVAAQQLIAAPGAALEEQQIAYEILRRSSDPLVVDFVFERLNTTDVQTAEKVLAARALSHFMSEELVPRILDNLATQEASVRVELTHVLHRITNQTLVVSWASNDDKTIRDGINAWNNWWLENKNLNRQQWLINGFSKYGIKTNGEHLPLSAADRLITLLKNENPHVVYNANRALQAITKRWAPLEESSGVKLHRHWASWWTKNRTRLLEESHATR